jgi:hypothetical protein
LGKKIKQLVQSCDLLTQQAFSIYDTPSEKNRKSPIINMLMQTVATYMLLRHLLISFILISVAGHIHFRPISTSLFVSAWFVFSNSPLAFILSMVLDFAVEAVLAIPVGVTSGTGLALSIA